MSEKKEYIERGAAIKTLIAAIHNDGFQAESNIERHELREDEIEDALLSIPAADVEPVVRCRDCEHSEEVDEESKAMFEGDPEFYCGHIDCPVDGNGFCSAGKRMAHMKRSGSGE